MLSTQALQRRFPLVDDPKVRWMSRILMPAVFAFIVFAVLLLAFGKNPISAYADVFKSTLGSKYGFSEVLVKMIPLVLTAVAVAVPARVGLVNVGGEGQLFMGAWLATWGALTFDTLPAVAMVPLLFVLGFLGGGLFAAISGILRARGWVNEVISTLLMNYIGTLIVSLFVFGPWKEAQSSNYPQSPEFVDAAKLPTFFDTRVHLGIFFAALAVAAFYFLLKKTRFGYEMRAIGGNQEAARRSGISVGWYIIVMMFIGGGIAGLAGLGEAAGIQGRLRPGLSPGYGFMGFLISWISGHNPIAIVFMSFLMAIITAGGDILQISHGLPFSAVNILMALILFVVLARRARKEVTR